jgi:hypothetical protein
MVDLPGIPSRHLKPKEKMTPEKSTSIFPAVLAEAKGARVSVSLFLIVAIWAGAYYLGHQAGSAVAVAQLQRLQDRQEAQQKEALERLRTLAQQADTQLKVTSVTDGRVQTLNAQAEVLKSKIDDCKR